MNKLVQIIFGAVIILGIVIDVSGQTRSFTHVEGGTLKARIENAIVMGRTHNAGGRFWIAYQFDVRPGMTIDSEIVDSSGGRHFSVDGSFITSDRRSETRELGLFLLFDTQLNLFARADIFNLQRAREFGGHVVYWAGRASNDESLDHLRAIVDSQAPEMKRLAYRATFAIALHDDARVESILIGLIRKPLAEPIRSRAIYWLGYAPESEAKNAFLSEIVRSNQEWSEARQAAMSALGLSRLPATLPLLENFYETMTSRELRRRALIGIARNDNRDGAAAYLIRVVANEKELELRRIAVSGLGRITGEQSLDALTRTLDSDSDTEIQKQAAIAIARRPRDEAIPILIRTARSHPKMPVRKQAIQILGQMGDDRAVALFKELLSK